MITRPTIRSPRCAACWVSPPAGIMRGEAAAVAACRDRRGADRGDPCCAHSFARHLRAPRVHAELAAKGISVGCKRVARLMTQAGLAGVSRRKFVVTTVKDGGRQAPDLFNVTSRRKRLTGCGWPTSPTSRPGQAFSISRSCSMPSAVALSAGRWPRHSPNNWSSMR